MVIAISTVVTILIVIGVVAVIIAVFVALGPLSPREQLRDDVQSGELLGGRLPDESREELRRESGFEDDQQAEERLDQENE